MEQLNESMEFQQQYWVRKKRSSDPLEKFVSPEEKNDNLIIYNLGRDFLHGEFAIQNPKKFEDEVDKKSFRNVILDIKQKILLKHRDTGEKLDTLRTYIEGDITTYLIIEKKWLRIRQYLGMKKWYIDCKNIKENKNEILDFILWAVSNNKMKWEDLVEVNSWDVKSIVDRLYGDASNIIKELELLEAKVEKDKEKIIESKIQNLLRIMKIREE